MFPYFQLDTIHLGPIPVHIWGLFVAIGIIAGVIAMSRDAKQRGLDYKKLVDSAFWILLFAFIGARLFHVFFYDWFTYSEDWIKIFHIWSGGFSSFGGFIAGGIVGYLMLKKYRGKLFDYADSVIFGLTLGWTIGRIGCFLIHDHAGDFTNFFLGVNLPFSETAFHDLGLYDSLLAFAIFAVLIIMRKLKAKSGMITATTLIIYGFTRFFLDFLRLGDALYFGLTPAQYLSVVLFIMGIFFIFRLLRQREVKNK